MQGARYRPLQVYLWKRSTLYTNMSNMLLPETSIGKRELWQIPFFRTELAGGVRD